MKQLAVIVLGLAALGVLALEWDQYRKPTPIQAEPPKQEAVDSEALVAGQAKEAARAAKKERIDAILARLEADGTVTRDDLVEHLTNEALDTADLDTLCSEREAEYARPD